MSTDRPVRSAKLIAKNLGVSERTVRRWAAKGILPAHKVNGVTSPLTVQKADIDRLKQHLSQE